MESICFNCESREFAHRIEECARNREDVTLWGVDYMPYPLDADGVPIHVGDVMEWVDEPGITRTVTSIQLANDGWWVYINGTGRRPDKYRHHHHAPTVEDVLREFAAQVTWLADSIRELGVEVDE